MKTVRYISLTSCLFIFSFIQAQQEILYTQYVFSQLAVNPSCAGNDDVTSLTALCRKQWMGIQGSPTTFSFLGQTLLNNKESECRTFSGSDKRNLIPMDNNKVGLGLILFNDKIGVSNTTMISLAYSYKIKFSPGKRLSFGLQASMINYNQLLNQLANPDPRDPVFASNIAASRFNFGTGIFYESDRYYAGLSVPQIIENKFDPNTGASGNIRQYFFTSGYVFYINHFYKFKPTIMARYTEGLPAQLDFNANLLYKDKIWFGLGYRYTNSVNVNFEILFSDVLRMGLAYEYPINPINQITHGSTEIMINYNFQKSKKRVSNPRYF